MSSPKSPLAAIREAIQFIANEIESSDETDKAIQKAEQGAEFLHQKERDEQHLCYRLSRVVANPDQFEIGDIIPLVQDVHKHMNVKHWIFDSILLEKKYFRDLCSASARKLDSPIKLSEAPVLLVWDHKGECMAYDTGQDDASWRMNLLDGRYFDRTKAST